MNVALQGVDGGGPGAAREDVLELIPGKSLREHQRLGLRDLLDTTRLWRLCWTLALLDIRLRYRGSVLGPFWLTLSTGVMVGAMGLIYSTLFKLPLHEYLPFLAISQVLWSFLAILVAEGCTSFTAAEWMIRSVRMPFTLYALRIVLRNMVVLAHNTLVIIAVYAYVSAWPGMRALYAVPALLLWLVDALALTVLLGALCARFRDIPPIAGSIMQIAFFVSPVIWKPELVGDSQWMLPFNPFFVLLEVVRAPLLGAVPDAHVYAAALAYSALLCAVSWLLFARARGRIAFWGVAMVAAVEVAHVNLDFPLYHTTGRSLKKTVFQTVTGRMGSDAKHRIVVQALRDISFSLDSGDRLGLIGSNGAGKTTLLRMLAGIYEPVSGRVLVRGSMNALLDPNLGMNPELTGRENIMLRGLYNGFGQAAIARLQEDVRDFAEMGEFLDLPVRIYSAGMIVRLGFALATAIRPQVLLMDEWFLAGDANFMEKARVRLEDMVRGAEILVLSSHNTAVMMDWCTRIIWMDQGRIREDGAPAEVLEHYLGHPVFPPAPA